MKIWVRMNSVPTALLSKSSTYVWHGVSRRGAMSTGQAVLRSCRMLFAIFLCHHFFVNILASSTV